MVRRWTRFEEKNKHQVLICMRDLLKIISECLQPLTVSTVNERLNLFIETAISVGKCAGTLISCFSGSHPQQTYNQKSPSGHRSPPLSSTHASTYSAEQHNTSRQIIMNDYYTSQQMQQAPPHIQASLQNQSQPRMDLSKRGPQPPTSGHHGHPVYILPPRNEHPSYRQSPTPPQHQQQRQGVIHRTNPNRKLELESFPDSKMEF